jgi:hypothetical protein
VFQPVEPAIAPYTTRPATIITARSFLIDRFTPDCEIVSLPAKPVQGGRVSARWVTQSDPQTARPRGFLSLRPAAVQALGDRPAFDVRRRTPRNWAHFLNNHLPVLFRLCAWCDLHPSDFLILTPTDTPGYIAEAAALFGMEVLATDAPVKGRVLDYEVEPWPGIRPARADWVHTSEVQALLAQGLADAAPSEGPLPRRVFLSRSDTRRLSNEAEIETVLEAYGFQKVYPERLPVADQFRLLLGAESVVAIHGAGLAPLLYRKPSPAMQLIELMPCGHMSDVYRVMAEQVGCEWTGVRGKIKAAYVEAAYRLGSRFDEFSLDSFEVDPVSLERALAMGQTTAEE